MRRPSSADGRDCIATSPALKDDGVSIPASRRDRAADARTVHVQRTPIGIDDLQRAMIFGEFTLAYQPLVSASNGAVTGCETLLRWQHPTLGAISPVHLVALGEESGMIVPIGDWVLDGACREAASWPESWRVCVNVSPIQLHEPGFVDHVSAALDASGLPPNRLELELTEGVLVRDAEVALRCISAIRALGVRVALDDFGTGFSSLGYLQRFTFDRLKIDRSFITGLSEGLASTFLVRAIHDIAHHFGMAVTAEGIETEGEASLLREIGSEELQGYLFARPVSNAALRHLIGGDTREPLVLQDRAEGARPAPEAFPVRQTSACVIAGGSER